MLDLVNSLRIIKSDVEVEILQYVNDVSSSAHIKLMKDSKHKYINNYEYLAESEFKYQCFQHGCRRVG